MAFNSVPFEKEVPRLNVGKFTFKTRQNIDPDIAGGLIWSFGMVPMKIDEIGESLAYTVLYPGFPSVRNDRDIPWYKLYIRLEGSDSCDHIRSKTFGNCVCDREMMVDTVKGLAESYIDFDLLRRNDDFARGGFVPKSEIQRRFFKEERKYEKPKAPAKPEPQPEPTVIVPTLKHVRGRLIELEDDDG